MSLPCWGASFRKPVSLRVPQGLRWTQCPQDWAYTWEISGDLPNDWEPQQEGYGGGEEREPRSYEKKEFQWRRLGASNLNCIRTAGKHHGTKTWYQRRQARVPLDGATGLSLETLGGSLGREAVAEHSGLGSTCTRHSMDWLVDTCSWRTDTSEN